MPSRSCWSIALGLALASAGPEAGSLGAQAQATALGLKIVVIAGEDAVNIIQQKTAVAPIVEVRDKNDQPVAGALVRFSIRGGHATFQSGVRSLSVTTDAAGRAAVTGLTPASTGAVEIDVSASYGGETATATITESNVPTAADAASAGTGGGSAGGSGGGAGRGGGGGGGGTTGVGIAVVAAGAATAALYAREALGSGAAPTSHTYTGPYAFQIVQTHTFTSVTSSSTCTITDSSSGTFTLTLDQASDGTVSGTIDLPGTDARIATTCSGVSLTSKPNGSVPFPVTGTVENFTGTKVYAYTDVGQQTGSVNATDTLTVTGAIRSGVATVTVTVVHAGTSVSGLPQGQGYTEGGSATFTAASQ